MLKLNEPFRNQEVFIISFFSIVQIWVLRVKSFLLQFLVDIFPLGSGSVDPHIFADSDPASQNIVDPTDPDPKHCLQVVAFTDFLSLELLVFSFWLLLLLACFCFTRCCFLII